MTLPSPLGPNAHYANHRESGVVTSRLACQCPIGTEHDDRGNPETFVWPDGPLRSSLSGPGRPSLATESPSTSPSGLAIKPGAPEGSQRSVRDLIEAGSLGTPDAKAMRASVSDAQAAAVVARSKELAELDLEFPEATRGPVLSSARAALEVPR